MFTHKKIKNNFNIYFILFFFFFLSCVEKEKSDIVPQFCEGNSYYCVYLYNNSISYYVPINGTANVDSVYYCYKELLGKAYKNWKFEYIRVETNLSKKDTLFIENITKINDSIFKRKSIIEEKSEDAIVFKIL